MNDATTDEQTIRTWWADWPKANIGVATGARSGIVVVDIDVDKHGEDSLLELADKHGRIAETVEQITGSGGRHIVFAHPGQSVLNSAGKLGAGIDVRGDGGYIVVAPSLHVSGRRYEWEASSRPSRTPLAPLPGWVIQATAPDPSRNGHAPAPPIAEKIIRGARNDTLASLAGTMRRRGMSVDAIEAALLRENADRCEPALLDHEVREIARSVARYDPKDTATGTLDEPDLDRDGDRIIWAWRDLGVGIGFELLRESSEGLHGEIHVEAIQPEKGQRPQHLHWAKFNLSSTDARSKLARHLTTLDDRFKWASLLETACIKTAALFRTGEPIIDLAEGDVSFENTFLMDNLLPEGETTVFFADGGSCKSVLSLAIALAVRTGISLPGNLRPTKQRNVLYLDWETQDNTQRRRLQRLSSGFGLAARPHVLYHKPNRSLPDDIARIRQDIDRYDVGLVIVDSIAYACGGDPEAAEPMIRAFNALATLKATRLVIAHVSKAAAESTNGRSKPFGSIFGWNSPRSIWEVKKASETRNPVDVALIHKKMNDGILSPPIGLRVTFDDPRGPIRLAGIDAAEESSVAEYASMSDRIRSALRRGTKWTRELADELHTTEATVRSNISRMNDVVKVAEGSGQGRPSQWGLLSYQEESNERF